MKRRFYPFVQSRGFIRQKSKNPYFVTFVRDRNGHVDQFDLQWDKYWRPHFVLNFGSLEHGEQPGRIQRRRGGGRRNWFGLHRPWINRLISGKWNYSPEQVIEELVVAFDDLEVWWSTGTAGPHVYIYTVHA